ncbi:hypothetical protein N5E15_22315 [Pantoea stewartii]|uniref:hypothetical protein n=1 Tax=Pantoea stewartii TaxID=66269 RepID=UPI0021D50EC7|nr:hypothetical protein [Pantoea stewartii]MCU7369309.1 hypothetical protein [Pantoea stewartii]
MSDSHIPPDDAVDEASLMAAVRAMKAEVDVIFRQLTASAYASPDTFANNWAHLIARVKEMKPLISQPGVADTVVRTDVMLMADLLAIIYAVGIVENFLACLEHQFKKGDGQDNSLT